MTWTNAPTADTQVLASLGAVSVNTWYEVDFTSHITGDGTYSLRVSDSTGGADYSSKEGTNDPKLLVAVAGATPQSCSGTATATATPAVTNTPTHTPTLGPSPTPTIVPTATATQPPPPAAFNNATFVYDGDGRRVKSIFNGTTTTYFVGAHYEVTDGVVTKYYYAGAQRIAMRTNGTLSYLLGDHLGSTSLVTDSAGNKINEQRYKAWGETRYVFGNEKTRYQYTGQFSYESDFGLYFYNARWYDPALGRFAQADSIIPGGVQGLDRYAYVNNSPVNYTDPSGHQACAWLGTCPDEIGVQNAIALMVQVSRGGNDILVAAGIAVQSQWADQPFHSSSSGQGPAQLSRAQLDTKYGEQVADSEQYGLGLTGADPNNPGTAVTGMSRRIYQVVNACGFCSAQDKIIVAGLAQNNGFTLGSLKDIRTSYYDRKTGEIDWNDYFESRSPSGDPIANYRASESGQENYDTRFMLLLYTNDLLELSRRGWTLPYSLTRYDIYDIRRKYLNFTTHPDRRDE